MVCAAALQALGGVGLVVGARDLGGFGLEAGRQLRFVPLVSQAGWAMIGAAAVMAVLGGLLMLAAWPLARGARGARLVSGALVALALLPALLVDSRVFAALAAALLLVVIQHYKKEMVS